MSLHNHVESHNRFSYVIRDAVIGLSDGLTVSFCLAAGLSGAVYSGQICIQDNSLDQR